MHGGQYKNGGQGLTRHSTEHVAYFMPAQMKFLMREAFSMMFSLGWMWCLSQTVCKALANLVFFSCLFRGVRVDHLMGEQSA